MIYKAMVHSAQTMHLSCTETNTASKRTKTSFHLSLATQEDQLVRPKQYLSLWYVRRKPCTHHASKLTLSPKGPKGDSSWPCHLGVPSGASKTIFCGYGTFGAYCGPILHWDKNTISNWTERDSTWSTSPRSSIGCVQNDFRAYGTFGANRAPILNQD
jgi:hypothetical protein